MLRYIWIALVVLGLDQWTKHEAVLRLMAGPIYVNRYLNLVLVYNQGAAFGFLSQQSGWQNTLFIAVAVAIIAAILVFLFRAGRHDHLMVVAMMFVLGGALGNLLDRIRLGHVIDFIDFHIGAWHWYTFNLADSAITIGAFLLAIDAFMRRPAPTSDKG